MKFTVEKINEIIVSLDYIVPAQPKLPQNGQLTVQEAFLLMAPKLNEQIEKGATIKELAAFLQAMEFPAKGAALRRLLDGYLAIQRKVRLAQETKPPTAKKSRKKKTTGQSEAVEKDAVSLSEKTNQLSGDASSANHKEQAPHD